MTFIVLAGLISACDSRLGILENVNLSPEIQFKMDGKTHPEAQLTDSVKLAALYPNSSLYNFQLSIKDDNLKALEFDWTGNGKLLINQIPFEQSGSISLTDSLIYLQYQPDQQGNHELAFRAEDEFGATSEKLELQIKVFENLPPVPKLKVDFNGVVNAFHYQLDASESFDQDGKWGGKIAEYQFSINGLNYTSKAPVLDYIFQGAGRYEIKLKVKDNEALWSDHITFVQQIN